MIDPLDQLRRKTNSDRAIIFSLYTKNSSIRVPIFYYKAVECVSSLRAEKALPSKQILEDPFNDRPYLNYLEAFETLIRNKELHFNKKSLNIFSEEVSLNLRKILKELKSKSISWYFIDDKTFVACQSMDLRDKASDYKKVKKYIKALKTQRSKYELHR